MGSGGTLAGIAMGLRDAAAKVGRQVKIGLADPHGAALYNYFANGELKSEGDSISEGIGQGRITANLENLEIDFPYRVSDEEGLKQVFDLHEHEGIVVGLSTGINVAGAVRLAKDMGPGHTIVTILCDHGARYASKIFNAEFLRSKGFEPPAWLEAENSPVPSVYEAE